MKQICTLVLLMLSMAGIAGGQGKDFPKYTPEATSVAIVPVVNQSGEKDPKFKAKQAESGNKELTKEFTEHGFKLISDSTIAKAITDLKIDMNDEENYNKATLYKIGKAADADLIVFSVITAVEQHVETKVFVVTQEGRATVKLWLLDAKNETPLISAVTKQGKSGGARTAFSKGSDEIIHAVGNGERDLLKDFFKPYTAKKPSE